MSEERLQKILAHAGVASRRAAETLIAEGRVRVNGRIVREVGTKADAHKDRIEVNGKRVVAEKPVYYVINKPREVVTTLEDPEGRETIGDLLRRIPERVYPIGRLDYHTSGVLLVTNDGEMAQALLHPRKQVPKTYVVKLRGHIEVPGLDALRNGVDIGDERPTAKAEVFVIREDRGNSWLQMTINEGRNRQIHRMLEALGFRVQRLSRVSFAGIEIEGLKPGQWRPINATELRKLKRDFLNPQKKAKEESAAEDAAAAAGPLATAARGRRKGAGATRVPARKRSRSMAKDREPAPVADKTTAQRKRDNPSRTASQRTGSSTRDRTTATADDRTSAQRKQGDPSRTAAQRTRSTTRDRETASADDRSPAARKKSAAAPERKPMPAGRKPAPASRKPTPAATKKKAPAARKKTATKKRTKSTR